MSEKEIAKLIKEKLDLNIKESNNQIDSLSLDITKIESLQKCNINLLMKEANSLGYNLKWLKDSNFKKLFHKNKVDNFIIAFYHDYSL